MVCGMTIWSLQESLPVRIAVMDGIVNVVSMVAAAFAAAWSLPTTDLFSSA